MEPASGKDRDNLQRPIGSEISLLQHSRPREVRAIEDGMVLLPDGEAIYPEWRRIVVQHSVSGVQVHDARLAAAMIVHGVGHILTLKVGDFSRFSGLTAVHPVSVQA